MTKENSRDINNRENKNLTRGDTMEDTILYGLDEAYISEEFDIPTSRLEYMNESIEKLNRKATKLGCPKAVVTVISEPFIKEFKRSVDPIDALNEKPIKIEFVRVSVSGEAPKLAGWEFVGFIDGDKLVYGDRVEDSERDRQGECDYCNISRSRVRNYVLAHENGERKVVGSSCLKDFLGGKSPKDIVRWLSHLQTFISNLSDEEEFMDDGTDRNSSKVYDLTEVLDIAWKVIRVHGWVSGSEAWNDTYLTSTSEHVRGFVDTGFNADFDKQWREAKSKSNLPESDPQLVADAIEWAKSNKFSDNNYLNNIGIIAENGYTTKRSIGMAISILSSYEREIEKRIKAEARLKASEESNHIGEINKREVFDNVQLTGVQYLESQFGTTVLHRFLADGTNQVVWFGSIELDAEVGDTFSIKATVKKHGEFNSIPQTTINRVVKI